MRIDDSSVRSQRRPLKASAGPTAAFFALLCAALLLAAPVPSAHAQVSGVSYTLSPVGKYAFFESDDDAGLENGFLYGGQLGFGFGRYLEVGAVYQQSNSLHTNFDNVALLDPDRDVDLQQYGGRLRVNLGTYSSGESGLAPYLSGGVGILHFDPEAVEESESIYVTGGVGVTLSQSDRYTLTVEGQGLGYRYNPASAFFNPGEVDEDTNPGQVDVFSPVVRAALQFYLGGRDPDETSELDRSFRRQFSGGGGARFFVEPFYGRIEFADELTGDGEFYRDQNVAGVNAGVNLGSYVGLRGFYWRGASGRDGVFDQFAEEFQPIAFYGGELNLRFGSSGLGGRSFTPYGIIGGGYVDVLSDYDDDIEPNMQGAPDGRYFGTLGGGLEVPLSDAFKLQGGVRSLFMSTQDAEDISTPDEVYANLMYSAGIEISLGGGGGPTPEELIEQRAEERDRALHEETRTTLDESERAMLEEIQRLQARIDSMERRERMEDEQGLTAEEANAIAGEDTLIMNRGQVRRQGRKGEAERSAGLTDRVIELPVPRVGEIYVRIGEQGGEGEADVETSYAPPTVVTSPPQGVAARRPVPQGQQQQQGGQPQPQQQGAAAGGLSREEISDIVSEELRQAREEQTLSRDEIADIVEQTVQDRLAAAPSGNADVAARNAQIRQLEEQIDDLRDDLNNELSDLEQRQLLRERGRNERPVVVKEGEGGETRVVNEGTTAYRPTRITPVAGFGFGGDGRFLLGVRGNYGGHYGGLGSEAGLRFMPEAAIGLGNGVGVNLLANAVYDFDEALVDQYLPGNDFSPYAGLGVGLTTQTGVGVNLLGGLEYDTARGGVFLEYSTVGFFDYNRVLIGYRIGF